MKEQMKPSLVKGWRVAAPEVDLEHVETNTLLEEPEYCPFATEGTYCKYPPNTDALMKS